MHLKHTDQGSYRESDLSAIGGKTKKLVYLWKFGYCFDEFFNQEYIPCLGGLIPAIADKVSNMNISKESFTFKLFILEVDLR